MALKRGPKPGHALKSTALARVQAHKIATSGKAPLDVMLGNMWFWNDHAENMQQQISDVMNQISTAVASGANDSANELLEKSKGMLKNFLDARANAQSCAVDAAPYIHPRLAAVQFKTNNTNKVIEVETVVPQSSIGKDDGGEKVSDPNRSYRDGYNAATVVPIRRAGG